jgi:molybdopterin converting factor small subunit
MPAVRIRCRLFARYAEVAGVEDVELEVPGPATVADAVAEVRRRLRNGHLLPARPLVARNHAHALPSDLLEDGDELALLPPLAGG